MQWISPKIDGFKNAPFLALCFNRYQVRILAAFEAKSSIFRPLNLLHRRPVINQRRQNLA
jgi:hypothetical protein